METDGDAEGGADSLTVRVADDDEGEAAADVVAVADSDDVIDTEIETEDEALTAEVET